MHYSDTGLVLRKFQLKDAHQSVVFLTKNHGKVSLTAFGTKKITSKRLSHLETGNVLKISWREKDNFQTLHETDLQYAHSSIKESSEKMDAMYIILFIVDKMAQENADTQYIYDKTLSILKDIHNKGVVRRDVEEYLSDVLMHEGFINKEQAQSAGFDVISFTEGLINQRIDI